MGLWRNLTSLIVAAAMAGASAVEAAPREGERARATAGLAAVDSLIQEGAADAALGLLAGLDEDWGEDPLFGWQLADRRGLALLVAGRTEDALPLLEATVGRRPYDAGAHRNLGLALGRLGKRGRALSEYAQAVELAPRDPVHRLEHAQYLAEFGQWEAAAAEFRSAGVLCGNCPLADRGLGIALVKLGRPAEGVEPLQRAWLAEPDASVRAALVAALHGAGRDSALLAMLDQEDRAAWEPADHLALVEAEGRQGDGAARSRGYAEALVAGRAPAAVSGDALFWARVALNLLQAGQYEAGLAAVDQAVALAPDSAVYRNNRVVLLLRLGRQAEAEREWDNVLRLDPSLKEGRKP